MENKLFENENIIALLGIRNLPDEKKIQIVEKVSELVQKRLFARVLESLDSGKKEVFMALLSGSNQEGLSQFLESNVSEFPAWIEEEVVKLKSELAEWSGAME